MRTARLLYEERAISTAPLLAETAKSPLPEERRERAIRRQAEGVREKEEVRGKME